jgi:hypothetical protein
MIEALERLNKRRPPNIRMKSIFSSMTIWGFLIALVSRFLGHEIAATDGTNLVTQAMEGWPLIVGVGADLMVAWKRVTATKFDVGKFASPVFWAALIGGAMTTLQTLGVDWSGIENLPEKVGLAAASIGGFVGFILQLIGRARASQPLGLVSDPAASPKASASIVIPSWVPLLLKLIPWRVLFAFILQRWAGISPAQFEEIIKTVGYAEGKTLDGGDKAMLVHDNLARAYPRLKPHEREAAVSLAVAGLASDGQLKLS